MNWPTYAAYGALVAGVLPLIFMSVGYLWATRRKRESRPRDGSQR